ncbi:hypothetical protein OXPF_11890 [Oxobacter pfennigii]|uniref:Uncharacterized protein n=1 Tax=Oxobacter pfennigii TaxID=36849 RepID=A0A0N8NTN1_9CLOT|nr:hypothetical protein [Oxobacter pfennigii]KPU45296.1 hypothetical protein OXPF_11890 [Oxobacter pfennigii]
MDNYRGGFGDENFITLDFTRLMQSCSHDLTYICELLAKLSGTYNLLIVSADGFNRNSFAKKDDIEDAIDRAEDLGKIIDKVINVLERQVILYADYLKTKNEYIDVNFSINDIIKNELEHHIIQHHEGNDEKK